MFLFVVTCPDVACAKKKVVSENTRGGNGNRAAPAGANDVGPFGHRAAAVQKGGGGKKEGMCQRLTIAPPEHTGIADA